MRIGDGLGEIITIFNNKFEFNADIKTKAQITTSKIIDTQVICDALYNMCSQYDSKDETDNELPTIIFFNQGICDKFRNDIQTDKKFALWYEVECVTAHSFAGQER